MRLPEKLIAIFAAMLAGVACVVCLLPKASRYEGEWYTQGFFNGAGMWEVKGEQFVLKHFVFFEALALTQSFTGDESGNAEPGAFEHSETGRSEAVNVSVEVIPRGIYIDHVRLPTTDMMRVFVMKGDRSLIPIPLTPAELAGLTPEFVSHELEASALWKEKLLPLVDPSRFNREQEAAFLAEEEKKFAALKARGIKLDRRLRNFGDGPYISSDWVCYPDGTSQLQCAFISNIRPIGPTLQHSNWKNDYFEQNRDMLANAGLSVFLEIYPTHYSINGKPLKPGKPYIQRPDGKVEVLELTPAEQQLFTKELLSTDRFETSELFLQRIAPLIGPPLPQGGPG